MQGQAEPAFDFGKQINDSTANGKPPLLLFKKKKYLYRWAFVILLKMNIYLMGNRLSDDWEEPDCLAFCRITSLLMLRELELILTVFLLLWKRNINPIIFNQTGCLFKKLAD